MRGILIITQKIDYNNDILGFFHEWVREFSKRWDKVTVICLKLGDYDLPSNVRVVSLGKEKNSGFGPGVKLKYLFRFYKYIWTYRHDYNAVFSHMNPQYIPLGWPAWKLLGKKMSLWYAHGYVPTILKIADRLTNIAFASTPEGYRLPSRKLRIVGQGIDVEKFKPKNGYTRDGKGVFKIVSVGRIALSKDYDTMIGAISALIDEGVGLRVEVAGSAINPLDFDYLEKLKNTISSKGLGDVIKFIGPIANKDLPDFLLSGDLFVNMSHTGSLDKAVLEAMSCGLPVLTCNEAYENILGEYREKLMYPKRDYRKLADGIKYIMNLAGDERAAASDYLRNIVVQNHNLEGLIKKISSTLLNE
ncbi:MAG TPA: glycosyltransferase [Candidatus Paceibacterota bacterium]